MIESGSADVTVFTDGSAEEGTRNGGAGAIVSRGSLDNPEVVEVLKKPAGVISSSTQAELVAIELAMDWLWKMKVALLLNPSFGSDKRQLHRHLHQP